MNKKSYLKEVYNESFNDELKKTGGVVSEQLSMLNPINWLGIPAGAIAAAITPTKTKKEMVEQQKKTLSNIFVPGLAAYRMYKRLGYSAKGNYGPVISEIAGPQINPLEKMVSLPAAIAAAATPTLTKKEMDEQQKKDISNIAIPGAGTYRSWKRLGYTQKELNKEVAKQKKSKKSKK